MARRNKNNKGYCAERCIEVLELNLCDYFKGKRRNSKPACRNCVHFNSTEIPKNKNKNQKKSITDNDI